MVFTKLSAQEKNAFFGLLDEYFQSRPELFEQHGDGNGNQGVGGLAGTGVSTAAATSAVQRALTAGTGSLTSGGAGGSTIKSNNPYGATMVQPNSADVAHAVAIGRVAAASLAFSGGGPPSHSQSGEPPSLPHRATSNAPAVSASLERAMLPGVEVDKLVTKKTSVFSAFKKPESTGVVIPPAFAMPKNTYGPPPVRRVTSDSGAVGSTGSDGGGSHRGGTVTKSPVPRLVPPAPAPASRPGSEVEEGEWAEVLYDYSSEDPGDLAIEAGTRVFVTDKSSDDWWTGQVEGRGRQGLFPASYIKLL